MESQSSAGGDIFAVVFLVVLFAVLFGLPIWLMVRHYRKSKPKIAAEKLEYERLSPDEKDSQKKAGYANLAGVVGLVIGILIGSRLLQNIIIGVVLGALLGGLFRFAAEKMIKA